MFVNKHCVIPSNKQYTPNKQRETAQTDGMRVNHGIENTLRRGRGKGKSDGREEGKEGGRKEKVVTVDSEQRKENRCTITNTKTGRGIGTLYCQYIKGVRKLW